MPPSEREIFKFGYFKIAFRNNQSAALLTIEIGMVVIHASIGESSEACGAAAPEPI